MSYLRLYHILIWILKSGVFFTFFFFKKVLFFVVFNWKKNVMQTISDTTPTENSTRFLCFVFFFFDWLNLKHLFDENHYWGKELSLSFFSGCWTYFSSEIAFFSLICLEKISKGVFYSQDVDLYIVLENIKNQYHCIFFLFQIHKMDSCILFAFIHNNVHNIYMPLINKNKICYFSHYTEIFLKFWFFHIFQAIYCKGIYK